MKLQCATASSTSIDDVDEASREIADAIHKKITLSATSIGILFCSIDFDLPALLSALKTKLSIPIVGCTTYSEATDGGYFEESASLLVLSSDTLSIGIGLGESLRSDVLGAVSKAYDQALASLNDVPKLILTFPDAALSANGERVLAAIAVKNTNQAPVFGGCPGDNGRFQQTYQLCIDRVVSDSIPIVMLGGDIDPVVVTRSGWIPVGTKVRATRVAGNRLIEIDGKPAIDHLKRYIGETNDPDILGTYPIAMLDETLGDDAERFCVLRSPFSYDKESGAIDFGGQIPEGTLLQLARGTRDDVIAGVTDAAAQLALRTAKRELSCVIFASCGARKLMLGMSTDREIAAIRSALAPGLPIAGFYSYGEIGALDSAEARLAAPRFHNTTIVLCGL